MPKVLLAAITLLGAFIVPAAGQAERGRVLLATVVDARAKAIVDLDLDDFVVTEGGQNREVLDVHVADYPVALLLDDGGDAGTGEAIRGAARRFVQRIGERPVLVGLFSNPAPFQVAFEDERQTLLDRLASVPLSGASRAPLLDVVGRAAGAIRAIDTPFSAVVIMSATPSQAADTVNSQQLPFIVETQAPIHVVAFNAAPAGGLDVLRALAEQTRGQYTQVFTAASYSVALDRLADRLSAEMIVGYLVPPNASGGDVRVGVKRPGARVLGLGVSK